MIKVLKDLAVAGKIKTYDHRSRGKFSIELFFPNCDDAAEAHSSLCDSVGANVVVGCPEMIGSNKVYFVNLPEDLDEKSLLVELDD